MREGGLLRIEERVKNVLNDEILLGFSGGLRGLGALY